MLETSIMLVIVLVMAVLVISSILYGEKPKKARVNVAPATTIKVAVSPAIKQLNASILSKAFKSSDMLPSRRQRRKKQSGRYGRLRRTV